MVFASRVSNVLAFCDFSGAPVEFEHGKNRIALRQGLPTDDSQRRVAARQRSAVSMQPLAMLGQLAQMLALVLLWMAMLVVHQVVM